MVLLDSDLLPRRRGDQQVLVLDRVGASSLRGGSWRLFPVHVRLSVVAVDVQVQLHALLWLGESASPGPLHRFALSLDDSLLLSLLELDVHREL